MTDKQRIATCGKVLFSAYRTDQFADADTFALQVAVVFEKYGLQVAEYLTDPRNAGALQNKHKTWPPTVGEITAACEEETTRREKARQSALQPKPQRNRAYVPPPRSPGCRANLLVEHGHFMYERVVEWSQSPDADECDYLIVPRGIRIALNVWHSFNSRVTLGESWKPMTQAELYARYGRIEAEAAGTKVAADSEAGGT